MYGPDLRSANAHSKAVTCTDTMHVREQYELPNRHKLADPHAHAHPDQQGLPKLASLVSWDPDVPYGRECPCACLPCTRKCVSLGSMSFLRLLIPWFQCWLCLEEGHAVPQPCVASIPLPMQLVKLVKQKTQNSPTSGKGNKPRLSYPNQFNWLQVTCVGGNPTKENLIALKYSVDDLLGLINC